MHFLYKVLQCIENTVRSAARINNVEWDRMGAEIVVGGVSWGAQGGVTVEICTYGECRFFKGDV